jgi:hypothetical protein
MADDDEPRERFQISVGQVAASSLAAVSAAVVCSFFGVAGTVIGTAIASFVATVGSALYSYSLRRTRARLRRLHRAGAASPPVAEVLKTMRQHGRHLLDRVQWAAIAIGAGAVFVFSIGVVTAIEGAEGESLSALFGVSHSGGDSSSLGSAFGVHHHRRHPQPAPTATPTTTPTPSKTPTGKPSPSASPSQTSSPSASASPSATPSASPSASSSDTSSPSPSASPSVSPTPTD